jgi:hypothetical protein
MTKKVLVIGSAHEPSSQLLLHKMKEEHGNNIIVVTPEEAKEQGLTIDDFCNIPTMKITAPPIIPVVEFGDYKSGKELRREKRAKERKKLRQAPVSNSVCNHWKGSSRAIINEVEHWQCMKCKKWFAN